MQDVDLYLSMNTSIYDTDEKKIIFTLVLLADGSAQAWKESFLIDKAKKDGGYHLGSAAEFIKSFKKAFAMGRNAWAAL
jgi:hypothetical protein